MIECAMAYYILHRHGHAAFDQFCYIASTQLTNMTISGSTDDEYVKMAIFLPRCEKFWETI